MEEYLFELNKDLSYESEIYKVSTGSKVQFTIGPTLFGYSIQIFTNAPNDSKGIFERTRYRKLKTVSHYVASFDSILFDVPGSYHFYFTIDDVKKGEGYILVEPVLSLAGTYLPLDSVKCLTVISKYLGKFSTWTDKLLVAKNANYNVVHFTPIQKLGESNSAYSLRDQLALNPVFNDSLQDLGFEQIKQFLTRMRSEWKMLSVCDVVLNHTANESEWIWSHPECSYNLVNCPHLRPAYLLDVCLHKFTQNIIKGLYTHRGLPPEINSEQHLEALRHILWVDVLAPAEIPRMYQVDVNRLVDEFQTQCRLVEPVEASDCTEVGLEIIQDSFYRKLSSTVDMKLALHLFNIYRRDCFDEDSRVKKCLEALKEKLEELNSEVESMVNIHLNAAVDNIVAGVRYFRVQADGPRIPVLSKKDPLVPRYFVEKDDKADKTLAWSDGNDARCVMAHNGWVMNDDPLRNFASSDSNVYLRRELIAWGDSIKLRFGDGPEDCPYLWEKMKRYVEMTAELFDGLRLDNCHSTPIHVAQYLLDAARRVNPNLYVIAELFTNSAATDNIFVNKLGITSLIRESMSAWDSHELGRLVYRYGGRPVGSMLDSNLKSSSTNSPVKLSPGIAHALFLDQSHDNPSPVEKRSPYDLLPSAALVAMASTAIGSNYGYDHLVPHHIDVVKETREYMGSGEENRLKCQGIIKAKAFLNQLHLCLSQDHFNEIFVDQLSEDIVCVTRHNQSTLESILMFAYTAFSPPAICPTTSGSGLGVTVTASRCEIIAQGFLTHRNGQRFSPITEYTRSDDFINGLSEYQLVFSQFPEIFKDNFILVQNNGNELRLNLTHCFLPGSIATVKLYPSVEARESADKLKKDSEYEIQLLNALENVDLIDVNHILFKCSREEPGGVYNVPGYGDLVYAGLQGIMPLSEDICRKDDQGHALCRNIRDGPWLADYTVARLLRYEPTNKLGKLLKERLHLITYLPAGMKPYYFFRTICKAYGAVKQQALSLMSPFIREGNDLIQALSLSSLQFVSCVESASLPRLSSSLQCSPHKPLPTIAAGLPHFSVDYMRSWGRDTFISVRGLLLLTGRLEEARWLILGYGACVRHGLIPNLLASGVTPRYNCRDAVWWWLQAIKEYVSISSSQQDILYDKVHWLFPNDSPNDSPKDIELHELILHCLQVHFQGLVFREHNAGKQIDEHMITLGFDNQIGVHPDTGFIFGGNEWNCGTWMDKMGSSCRAGTKGKPATPRDGSAVELVGLSYSVISWLDKLYKQNIFPHSSVTRTDSQGEKTVWTWSEWAGKIKKNFEKEFWVGIDKDCGYANKRNIYKDTVGAHQPWEDYRLRPNFLITLTVAPELFNCDHARLALDVVESKLVGPLGIKTLDPDDVWYVPDYDNSNDSDDAKAAHGFNYHQGPEWLWPMGYYLRARLHFGEDSSFISRKLSVIWSHLTTSPWRGLPELTNSNGSFCKGSCNTQAWSVATILEALYDLEMYTRK